MPKQSGLFKLKGQIDGFSFYERNGESLMRRAGGISAERIKTDPDMARIRENNTEFGLATVAGKAVRMGLVQVYDNYTDTNATARMVKVCRAVIGRATGVRGQRSFLPVANKDLLQNFIFDEGVALEEVFRAPYSVALNAGRNVATLSVPDFNTGSLLRPPVGATYFRLVCVCAVVSAYVYDVATKQYLASDVANNGKNAFATSAYIALGPNVGAATSVVATITPAPTLAATSASVVCIGIEFSQLLPGGVQYPLKGGVVKISVVG
jgi:hypothetical protein